VPLDLCKEVDVRTRGEEMEAAQDPTEVDSIFCFTRGAGRAIGIVVDHTLFVFTNSYYPGAGQRWPKSERL
jgi:hypothetical protein